MLKIKVCGMKHSDNINELVKLPIDYMGIIFYARSPRNFMNAELGMKNLSEPYLSEMQNRLKNVPPSIKRVGVVVNEMPNFVNSYIEDFGLNAIQLHGSENVFYCQHIRENNPTIEIIKAFNVSTAEDFEKTKGYEGLCNYFLFDTKTEQHGGSGKKFDWKILDAYNGETPFFLSGGISMNDVEEIRNIAHPQLYALDLNSKFETELGRKDINLIEGFLKEVKQ